MKNSFLLCVLIPLFLLTACGDGWEMRSYHDTPYDGDRTAGSGVEYVRARLMPERGPVLKPASQLQEPDRLMLAPAAAPTSALEPAPMNNAEKIFHGVQKK